MCLVLTNPVEILAVQLVKQGIEAGGSVQDILQITIYFFQTHTWLWPEPLTARGRHTATEWLKNSAAQQPCAQRA